METLFERLQVADSQNQYNPYGGTRNRRRPIMSEPCSVTSKGDCVSRTKFTPGVPVSYVENPPPESQSHLQDVPDDDMGMFCNTSRHGPESIGTDASDVSRGMMLLPSAADMPIVKRTVLFDTRTRDPSLTPTATSVRFRLDQPILSVSRIAVHSMRVPIYLDPTNAGLQAEDYVMLSLGLNLNDTNCVVNMPDGGTTAPTFNRAIAHLPLAPSFVGSSFATLEAKTPPAQFYTDFMKPIPSIENIELSWWRFQKSQSSNSSYIIPNTHPGTVGFVNENAYVCLIFYCKNRRPE